MTIVPNWAIFFSLMETPAWNSVSFKHKFICVTSSGPLDVLNVYWFTKIIRVLYKHYISTSKRLTPESIDDANLIQKKLLNNNDDNYSKSLLEKNE